VEGGQAKLCNEELHNLLSSPNIIRVVKSRTFSWTGHIACAGGNRIHATVDGKARGNKPLEDAYMDGLIILKLIVKKLNWKFWTGFDWLRIGVSDGFSCVQE
jgi:hypothetical protein